MAESTHKNLTGAAAVHPASYVASTDPGAVGAHKFWTDTSSGPPYQLKKRNAANSAWEAVGQSVTLFNDAEGNSAIVETTTSDGTSTYAARRDHAHSLGIITTRGDLIRGGSTGAPERVALGTNGFVLTSNGSDAVWAASSGGGASGAGSGGVRLRIGSNLSVSDATDTIVGWDTEDVDSDTQHFTSSANLTGTVSKAGTTTLTGTSTAFDTELSVGQVISVPGTAVEKRVVTAIASATSLTVSTAFAHTASGQTAVRLNSPIVMRQAGRYDLAAGAYWAADADGFRRLEFVLNDTTPFGQDARTSIGATAMGQSISASRQFNQWDFVELRVHHTAGAALNLTADERTFLSCNSLVGFPYVLIEDQKAQNTAGGAFTSGADQTRTLNTIVSDTAGIASLASNQITLPSGRYRYSIVAPAFSCDKHQAMLYNVTTTAIIKRGSSVEQSGAANISGYSFVRGVVTLATQTTLEVRHRCQTTRASDGFGRPANFGTEVYTVIELWKEA